MYSFNKYRNKKTVASGITFDSKKEAARFAELSMLEKAGKINGLQRQFSVPIIPACDDERMSVYKADFVYFCEDVFVIEDCKSDMTRRLPAYILKRKLVKALYVEKTMSSLFTGKYKDIYDDLRIKTIIFNENI